MKTLLDLTKKVLSWLPAALLLLVSCSEDNHRTAGVACVTLRLAGLSAADGLASVEILPNEHTAKYWYAIGGADDLAAFESGTFGGIVTEKGNTAKTVTFPDLERNTAYTIFASGENAVGSVGKTSTLEIKLSAESAQIAVTVLRNDDGETLTVGFKPGDSAVAYSYAIGSASDRDAFADGSLKGIVRVENGERAEVTFRELVTEEEYTVFARAFDKSGEAGEVVSVTEKLFSVPRMFLDVKEHNALYLHFDMRFSQSTAGANPLIARALLWPILTGGDPESYFRNAPWAEPRLQEDQYVYLGGWPGKKDEPGYVGTGLWINDKETFYKVQVEEIFAADFLDGQALPAEPEFILEEMDADKVVVRVKADENTRGLSIGILSKDQVKQMTDEQLKTVVMGFDYPTFGTTVRLTQTGFLGGLPVGDDGKKTIVVAVVLYTANGFEEGALYSKEYVLPDALPSVATHAPAAGPRTPSRSLQYRRYTQTGTVYL